MKERSELIEWLRGEIVREHHPVLGEPTVITFAKACFPILTPSGDLSRGDQPETSP